MIPNIKDSKLCLVKNSSFYQCPFPTPHPGDNLSQSTYVPTNTHTHTPTPSPTHTHTHYFSPFLTQMVTSYTRCSVPHILILNKHVLNIILHQYTKSFLILFMAS